MVFLGCFGDVQNHLQNEGNLKKVVLIKEIISHKGKRMVKVGED